LLKKPKYRLQKYKKKMKEKKTEIERLKKLGGGKKLEEGVKIDFNEPEIEKKHSLESIYKH
jgi:hypothetical protein